MITPWSVENEGIIKRFSADTDETHHFVGVIENSRDEEWVRATYAPGRKGIKKLTINTYHLASWEEITV